MADISVGYYVHHHGEGHMQRALQIIPHIPYHVILFSSAEQPHNLPANVTYLRLEDDAVSNYHQPQPNAFLYTPLHKKVIGRYRQILQAVLDYRLTCIYVDVSMEVAIFCKTLGLRVGHNVMAGIRDDQAHTNLYRMCDFYIADSTSLFDAASKRRGPQNIYYIGGISRYKKMQPVPVKNVKNVVLTFSPKSEQMPIKDIRETVEAYPHINWHVIGLSSNVYLPGPIISHGIIKDPFDLYHMADVVIGAGGHNTITEMASLGKHFICVPEDRPYAEQIIAAKALSMQNMAVSCKQWPKVYEWPTIFEALQKIDIEAFQSIVADDAAASAARIIAEHV